MEELFIQIYEKVSNKIIKKIGKKKYIKIYKSLFFLFLSILALYRYYFDRLSLQTVRRDRSEIISPGRRYEKRITIPRRATQTANRKVPGNIRRSVSAETSIPRIEYGPDGEHQRQYDRGYPSSSIETAPPRDGNRKDDGSRIRKSIMQDRRHNGIYPLYGFRMWQRTEICAPKLPSRRDVAMESEPRYIHTRELSRST